MAKLEIAPEAVAVIAPQPPAPPKLKNLPENLAAQIVHILESPDKPHMIDTAEAIAALLDQAVTPLVKAIEQYRKKSNWDYGIFVGGESFNGQDIAVEAVNRLKKIQTPERLSDVYQRYDYQP